VRGFLQEARTDFHREGFTGPGPERRFKEHSRPDPGLDVARALDIQHRFERYPLEFFPRTLQGATRRVVSLAQRAVAVHQEHQIGHFVEKAQEAPLGVPPGLLRPPEFQHPGPQSRHDLHGGTHRSLNASHFFPRKHRRGAKRPRLFLLFPLVVETKGSQLQHADGHPLYRQGHEDIVPSPAVAPFLRTKGGRSVSGVLLPTRQREGRGNHPGKLGPQGVFARHKEDAIFGVEEGSRHAHVFQMGLEDLFEMFPVHEIKQVPPHDRDPSFGSLGLRCAPFCGLYHGNPGTPTAARGLVEIHVIGASRAPFYEPIFGAIIRRMASFSPLGRLGRPPL